MVHHHNTERRPYGIHIPPSLSPQPLAREINAAAILADFFLADVYFVERSHAKTPDFKIRNQYWELKSPSGNGKRTIQHTLESAKKQSLNIILDMRRSKIQGNKIINEIESGVRTVKGIRRLIVILKSGDVMSINI